ncbi:MAG: hypothetical protein QGI83_24300, partial [Candidatus Latescibacteria bacterium]|nr:hypothetical protein [Candidatus Latescibacterota bacterium]
DLLDRPDAPQAGTGLPSGGSGASSATSAVGDLGIGDLKPISVPLVLSGFAPQAVTDLRERLLPLGLVPIQGGGSADSTLPTGAFEPGASLGVELMRGDLSMVGIGTLTYRDGDRVVGFGHELFSSGTTSLPMTACYIHGVLPSQMLSFKIGTSSHPVGAIQQDRAPGVAGTIGREAAMLPAGITVRSPGSRVDFSIEVVRNRDLTPVLLRSAVLSALISAEKLSGETTVSARARFTLADRPALVLDNVYAGPTGLGQAVLGVTSPLSALLRNPFETVDVRKVEFELEVEERAQTARIASVRLDRGSFEPGDTARVTVVLQPYLGDPYTVSTDLGIPRLAGKGRLTLRVASAAAHRSAEPKRAPGEYRASDFDDLLRLLRRAERNDDLIFDLLSKRPGVTVEGREVTSLPASVLAVLRLSRESGTVKPVTQTVLERKRLRTGHVLSGSQTVYIDVGRERGGVTFDERDRTSGKKR